MVVKLKKSDFNAGSPYSCWLKEEIIGEISDYENGFEKRGLVKKHNIKLFDGMDSYIMENISKFDDYPDELKAMAADIIRAELDPTFKE